MPEGVRNGENILEREREGERERERGRERERSKFKKSMFKTDRKTRPKEIINKGCAQKKRRESEEMVKVLKYVCVCACVCVCVCGCVCVKERERGNYYKRREK